MTLRHQLGIEITAVIKSTEALIDETDRLIAVNKAVISALRQCWEWIDNAADGAPDAPLYCRKANELWATVKDALEKAGESTDHE